MAHLPFLLQQSMMTMDKLQATMEEVRPLMWFTAGLFVLTLLLTAMLIFRKQSQKKNKLKTPENPVKSPVKEEIAIKTEEKQHLTKEEVFHGSSSEPEDAETPSAPEEPFVKTLKEEEEVPSAPKNLDTKSIPKPSAPFVHATKEDVTALIDDALKETKSREENLEAIKKRLQELGAEKQETQKTPPPPTQILEVATPPDIVITTKDKLGETIEEAEVIYIDAEPMFEPIIQPSDTDETEAQLVESMTLNIEAETPKEAPSGSMLPQQIKTFADWLREFK
jgi:hypothetical protein